MRELFDLGERTVPGASFLLTVLALPVVAVADLAGLGTVAVVAVLTRFFGFSRAFDGFAFSLSDEAKASLVLISRVLEDLQG